MINFGFEEYVEFDLKIKEKGLNISPIHVDFMTGTSDLEIEAQTNKSKR